MHNKWITIIIIELVHYHPAAADRSVGPLILIAEVRWKQRWIHKLSKTHILQTTVKIETFISINTTQSCGYNNQTLTWVMIITVFIFVFIPCNVPKDSLSQPPCWGLEFGKSRKAIRLNHFYYIQFLQGANRKSAGLDSCRIRRICSQLAWLEKNSSVQALWAQKRWSMKRQVANAFSQQFSKNECGIQFSVIIHPWVQHTKILGFMEWNSCTVSS